MQEEELCNIAFPMCICRLTLAWISSENSTTHEECRFILTGLPSLRLDPLSCRLVTSPVRCRLATRVTLRQLPSLSSFVQLLLVFPSYFRSRRDLESRPLFGFAPKQTKGSSAWRTTYIVLHCKYKDEDNRSKILYDKNYQTSSQKFRQLKQRKLSNES